MVLSVVIVNWNSKDHLRTCLRSLVANPPPCSVEIIVVDGDSRDGCGQMLAEEFPVARLVQLSANVGFGRASNAGSQHAEGDLLLFLNPDTELRPGALTELLECMQAHADAGIVGPRLLNSDGSLQTSCVRALPTPLNRALDSEELRRLCPRSKLWGSWEAFHSAYPVPVEAVSGACMMMRADTFFAVGGFSPDYFLYGEDMDLCAKVRKLGLAVYHVPMAAVVHHGGKSSGTLVSQFSTVMMRYAWATYMRLHHGRAAALWYRILQGCSAIARICVVLAAVACLRGQRRATARTSLQKWWYVLRWVVGASPIRPPALPPAGDWLPDR